ncbi:MAG: hypothetical protein VW557_12940 [Rhodospirillaceae bacterium]
MPYLQDPETKLFFRIRQTKQGKPGEIMQIIEKAASHILRRIIRSAIEPISGPKIATITPLNARTAP